MAALVEQAKGLLFDWRYYPQMCKMLLIGEALLSSAIVLKVPCG